MVCGFRGATIDKYGKYVVMCKCGQHSKKTTKTKAYGWLSEHSPWGPLMELNRAAFGSPR